MEPFRKAPIEGTLRFLVSDMPSTLRVMFVRFVGIFQTYLFPMIPILTVLGVATIYQTRLKWSLVGALVFSTIIYFYVLQILITSGIKALTI